MGLGIADELRSFVLLAYARKHSLTIIVLYDKPKCMYCQPKHLTRSINDHPPSLKKDTTNEVKPLSLWLAEVWMQCELLHAIC